MKISGIELEKQDILDILTTAYESNAVGYWAAYDKCKRNNHEFHYVTSFHLHEVNEDETGYCKEYTLIDGRAIIRGVEALFRGFPNHDYIREAIAENDVDSEAADIIIQVALFGEIKYG